MTNTKTRLILALAGWLASFMTAGAAAPSPLVVCYPGGAVNEQDAKGAMDAMLRVVERVGQWPQNSFTSLFSAKAAECRQLLAENKPSFAITSLGLYLELHDQNNLVPLVQPRIDGRASERYRVVVQKGKFKTLDELKGKSLGGTVLEEPQFTGRIVFAGKVDPAGFFVLKPSKQAIRALRALDKGEIDAVILNEQQYSALASLALTNPLEALFTSEEIPLMGVVADSKTSTAEERARFAKALEGMCSDPEGKKLCDLFGIRAFAVADPAVFEPMLRQWNGRN
ncbi:MAG: PhnD/SsuA/transferrin family substrate-binding protein [Methylococcaceae bacterium]|nr:PhnD/SsuA/transferrin family substrate-binding protein [Methylococcaceae bacterium]